PTKLGVIPLSDGAGEVAAIGAGVTRVKVGDRIAGCFHPRWFGGPISPDYLTNRHRLVLEREGHSVDLPITRRGHVARWETVQRQGRQMHLGPADWPVTRKAPLQLRLLALNPAPRAPAAARTAGRHRRRCRAWSRSFAGAESSL